MVLVKRLPDHSSIFSAEARAILLALNIIEQSPGKGFLILSDSLPCLQSLENRNFLNCLVLEILERLDKLLKSGYAITFVWVPSHIGIAGNTVVDACAKAALSLQMTMSTVPYSDFKPLIGTYIQSLWQTSWNGEINKFHRIQPVIGSFKRLNLTRRDEVIIHRLRVGHTHLTHSYLLRKELAPMCDVCSTPLTVEHLLLSCSKYAVVRRKFFGDCQSIERLFCTFHCSIILAYLKEIDIYRKL